MKTIVNAVKTFVVTANPIYLAMVSLTLFLVSGLIFWLAA